MAEWSFFFYQMFVSGAAFSVYKTALVILLQLQFLQPLFFLLALFGFDWIFLNLMELPRAVELLDAYILILLAVKHLQILSLMCPWGSNCVLQLPLNHTVKVLIFHSIKPCLVNAHITFVPLLFDEGDIFSLISKVDLTLRFSWAL